MRKNYKIAMVFGAFDCFHKGHLYFLKRAQRKADKLIVALTPDEIILAIKGDLPWNNFKKRKNRLLKEIAKAEITQGDKKQGSWKTIKKNKPDVIVIGYDQKNLHDALVKFLSESDSYNPKIIISKPYKPEKYQSRFLKRPRKTIRISGKIQKGKGEARTLGFPTINLALKKAPPSGIYSGRVHLHGEEYKSAIFIGIEQKIIEAYMIDYRDDKTLYNEWVVIEIEKKLREVKKTKDIKELKKLIAKDVRKIKHNDITPP